MEQNEAADDLTKAAKAYRRTERAHEEARQALKQAARAALAAGVKQSEVVKTTGWTREYLRRLRKGESSDSAASSADSSSGSAARASDGSAESAAPAKSKK